MVRQGIPSREVNRSGEAGELLAEKRTEVTRQVAPSREVSRSDEAGGY